MDKLTTPVEKQNIAIPAKLSKYSDDDRINNQQKQMHDFLVELNNRVRNLENP